MKKLGNIELVAKKIALPLIILAAGASSRWGKPKQLLPWRGQNLLERALQVGLESGASPLILVLGAWRQEIERVCPQLQREGAPWRLYFNPHWSQGMASSLRVGLEGALQLAPQAPGVLIHLADLPLVEAALVRRVAQAALSSPQPTKALAFPQYGGRRGHPVYIGRAYWPQLLELQGDEGARSIIKANPRYWRSVELESEVPWLDCDTPESYRLCLERAEGRSPLESDFLGELGVREDGARP